MSYVNPQVPTDDRVTHVPCNAFLPIPRFINRIGLHADEIGIYINQFLCSNSNHDFEDEKGSALDTFKGDVVWRSYKYNSRDLHVGNDKLSFVNQLFENSGLWRIDRPNEREKTGRKINYVNREGEKIEIKSNLYEFLVFDAKRSPELISLFRKIVAEERERLTQFYKQNRGKMKPRKSGNRG